MTHSEQTFFGHWLGKLTRFRPATKIRPLSAVCEKSLPPLPNKRKLRKGMSWFCQRAKISALPGKDGDLAGEAVGLSSDDIAANGFDISRFDDFKEVVPLQPEMSITSPPPPILPLPLLSPLSSAVASRYLTPSQPSISIPPGGLYLPRSHNVVAPSPSLSPSHIFLDLPPPASAAKEDGKEGEEELTLGWPLGIFPRNSWERLGGELRAPVECTLGGAWEPSPPSILQEIGGHVREAQGEELAFPSPPTLLEPRFPLPSSPVASLVLPSLRPYGCTPPPCPELEPRPKRATPEPAPLAAAQQEDEYEDEDDDFSDEDSMWAQGSDAFDESDDDWAMPNETKAIFNLPSWLWRRGGDPPPFDCVNVGKGEGEWKGRDKGDYLGEVEVVWEGEDEEGEFVEVST